MDKEYNVKEEIYKCSKCGLCKSVCPVFLASKNEMFLARGRYIVLNAFYNLSKKLSSDFVKNLDVCLNCNACKNFCPSNIDAYKVFTETKSRFRYKFSIVNFSFIYRLLLNIIRVFRLFYKIFHQKSIFSSSVFCNLFEEKVLRVKRKNLSPVKGKVIYFEGCVNKYINKSDKNASLNLIEDCGYIAEKIISDCCGYPYISEGNFKRYKKQLKKIISMISDDIDFIICSCDTCFDTLKRAVLFFDADKNFVSKLVTLDEFLKLNNYKLKVSENGIYFRPLLRNSKCYLTENVVEIQKKGLCSLMENFFMLKYPKLSEDIIKTSFYTKDEIEGKTIITSCMLSLTGLKKAMNITKSSAKVCSYAEYICCMSE